MGQFRTATSGRAACAMVLATVFAFSCAIAPVLPCDSARAADLLADPVSGPPGTLELAGLQQQFEIVGRQFSPAVVAISAIINQADGDDLIRSDQMNGEKLSSLLERSTRIVGSGFVIDPEGYILTNEHVVGEAEQLWVTTDTRQVYPAMVIGSDPRADLAVLKIPADRLPSFHLAPAPVQRGQWTIAVGNPYGLASAGEMCLSVGVVSATGRSLPRLANRENRLYNNLIQTTAEINPGNSGGPLLNLQGQVIGINTAVVMPQKSINGIGFALPITDSLLKIVQQLRKGEEVRYGYLGVRVTTPTAQERREAGAPPAPTTGACVDDIETDSAAHNQLQPGDLITTLNGSEIRNSDDFVQQVGDAPIGQSARLILYRGGQRLEIDLPIGPRPLPSVAITRENRRLRWQGMVLGNIPPHWTAPNGKHPLAGVMVVALQPNSPQAAAGVRQGSILTAIAGRPVHDIIDLQRILNETPAQPCQIEWLRDNAVVSAGE